MVQVGELQGIAEEENGRVVAYQVPVSRLGIELDGKAADIALGVSLYRIRVSPTRCNGCGACGAACPTNAAKDIVAGRLFAADCYSCARCLTVCPHDAIRYCRRLEAAEAPSIE